MSIIMWLEFIAKEFKIRTLWNIAIILLIIGGINWGLVGLFDYNLVAAIFGDMSAFTRFIYILVGLSAIYVAVTTWTDGRERM